MKLLLCLLLQLPSADPPGNPGQDPAQAPPAAVSTQQLVQQLEQPTFALRQAASAALLKLPESAAPELLQARTTATGELATRLDAILSSLRQRWFRERLKRLTESTAGPDQPGDNAAADFPDAARFHEMLAGEPAETTELPGGPAATTTPADESETSRRDPIEAETGLSSSDPRSVLLQLLQAESEVFAASLYQPERIAELLETRSAALALDCDGREDRPFPTASALALMLVASRPEIRLLRKTSANISRPLEDPRFDRLIQTGRHRAILRSLASAWIRRPGIAADRPLIFAIRHRLSAGRDVAVRVLQGEGRGPQLFYACMCLAALGSQEDIPLLEARLTSTQPIWPPRGAAAEGVTDKRLQVQVRDAALAALLHLQQIPPSSVGLKLVPSWDTLYRIDTVGAVSDDIREERTARYRAATAK